MIKTTTKLKGWGNSIGVVLPKDKLDKALLDVGDDVELVVKRKTFALKRVFGVLNTIDTKKKKSLKSIVSEVEKEIGKKAKGKGFAANKKNYSKK